MISGAKESAAMFEKKAGTFLLIYTICTAIALIIDTSVVLTGMGKLGEDQDEFGTAFVLILATMYFMLAFYFPCSFSQYFFKLVTLPQVKKK